MPTGLGKDALLHTLTVARRHRRAATLGAAALIVALHGGCALLKKPDLSRTAGIASIKGPRSPLILIHGFLGSKLRGRESGRVAWGTMANILTGRENQVLALPMGPEDPSPPAEELEPFEVYDSLWGVEYYGKILRILREAGGYQVGDIENPVKGDNAFIFVYDWRRDNVESARRLAEAIGRLKAWFGDPRLRFNLLAHSQGGLIARYYAKYGGVDVLEGDAPPVPTLAGAASIDKVIMLGTPNRGSLDALKFLHLGIKRIFRPMPPPLVFTMPALYQMLPPRESVHFATLGGSRVNLNLYDPETWVREEWSVFAPEVKSALRKKLSSHDGSPKAFEDRLRLYRDFLARMLTRAERFHRALNAPAPSGVEVPYYAFGSDCISTLKTALVVEQRGRREVLFDNNRFRHDRIGVQAAGILYGPGDGTVLMRSLLDIPDSPDGRAVPVLPGAVNFNSAFFVCESHGLLPNDPIFQNNLFYVLLWNGTRSSSAAVGSSLPSRF